MSEAPVQAPTVHKLVKKNESNDTTEIISKKSSNYLFEDINVKLLRADEEFIKRLLLDLSNKGLVIQIKKNNNGDLFLRRSRWRLSTKVYEIYKSKQ